MNAVTTVPLIEQDTVVHFVYRGSASTLTLAGDVNNWSVTALSMIHVGGTNFWHVDQVYPTDARLEYKYVINGSNWILDPRNPNQVMEGFGPNSELRMPAYVSPPEITYYPDIPHGTSVDTTWYSTNLSNSRKIEIYLPAGYSTSSDSFPVIYFQDGSEAVSLENGENVIDYLTAHKMIRPIIAVFVSYVNRTPEYAGNQVTSYMNFFVNELVPFVDSRFRTLKSSHDRGVIGASYGGNISLWLGMTYPSVFGNIGAQSSYVDPTISSTFQSGSKLDLKLYMDLGTYDITSLIPMVHSFLQIVKDKGYEYEYHEYNEGHSWANWRAHIKNALELFYPPLPAGVKKTSPKSTGYYLNQNFPNPFNPSTVISYQLSANSYVSLRVYDILGREVETIVEARQPAGSHMVRFDGTSLAGGVYICCLTADGRSDITKMIMLK